MFFLILIIALLLYGGLVYYIGWSGYVFLRPKTAGRRFKILYIVIVLVAATSFIVGRVSGITFLNIIGAYWMACFYLLLMLIPLAHITVILLRFTKLSRPGTQLWTGIITLGLLLTLLLLGTYNAYSPVVRTYDIKMNKGTASLDSLHIAMAADTHFGLLSGKNHAKRLVKEINELKPDIILLPGDLFDDDVRPFLDQKIDTILSGLQAPYGVYASLGNHDKHDGTMRELIEALENSGVNVLYDETVTVEDEFTIIGRKDRTEKDRLSLEKLMSEVNPEKPAILLEHQPYDYPIAEKTGVDLMVSGHTHHGQIFPGNLITDKIYENDWGYLRKGKMHTIVTSGFGFWGPPIRLGTRSEVVSIQIQFE